jgi:hypothetical protein
MCYKLVRHLLAYEGQFTTRRPGKIGPIAACGARGDHVSSTCQTRKVSKKPPVSPLPPFVKGGEGGFPGCSFQIPQAPLYKGGESRLFGHAFRRLRNTRLPNIGQPMRGRDTTWPCSHLNLPKSGAQVARPSTKDACGGVRIDAREQQTPLGRRNRRER